MKKIAFFYFLFLSYSVSSQNFISEENRSSEIRGSLMFSTSLAGYVGASQPTYLLTGFDVKTVVNSKKKQNLSFLIGAFFQKGSNNGASSYDNYQVLVYASSSSTYGGGIYFGPQISTHYKYINLSAYIAGGVFSFHDEILEVKNKIILYQKDSDFTSLGTKAGVNISFVYKWISLTGGYQIFVTAGDQSTLLYHGIEVGLGVKF